MMTALDIKQQDTTQASPLSLSPKAETPLLSFASLLKSVKDTHIESETLQNGVVALALQESEAEELPLSQKSEKGVKKKDLLSLLQTQEKKSPKKDDVFVELNPKITQTMTKKELKVVIIEAKQYLKAQIIESDAFKKREIASFPKTLKGLAQVAQKIGVDVSKITLEKVQRDSLKPKSISKEEIKAPKIATAFDAKRETPLQVKQTTPTAATAFDAKRETPLQVKQTTPITATAFEKSNQEEPESKQNSLKTVTAFDEGVAKEVQGKQKSSQITATAFEEKSRPKTTQKQKEAPHLHESKAPAKEQLKTLSEKKIPRETPLFKAQTQTKITTEELVAVKSLKQEPVSKKEKSVQTLELLLRGEKVSKSTNSALSLTSDFSVTTAKVIAPSAATQSVKNLETLLGGGSAEPEETQTKSEITHIAKAESFEVKLGEAKQMMKYLSHDIKTAIEDYKSPFTRVKVQLNPQKLGEIDLTIVQRGKNLHINLSSNNAAINTLAMNANDLKIQLNNSGINNATLNFNNSSQTSDGSFGSQTQQQHQQREEAQSRYNYFAQEESSEEILSSLEIVVPYYA